MSSRIPELIPVRVFLLFFLLFCDVAQVLCDEIEPLASASIRKRVKEIIKEATVLSDSLPEGSTNAARYFYNNVKLVGYPARVLLDGKPAAYKVPLFSYDGTADFIYLSSVDGAVIEYPTMDSSGALYYLTWEEWVSRISEPIELSSRYFLMPSRSGSVPFSMLMSVERNGERWVMGIPVDPSLLTGFYLVKGWDELPIKNMEETMMSVSRRSTRENGKNWVYRPEPRHSPLKHLSYAASVVADWLMLGAETEKQELSYRSWTNGLTERGVNPRLLESMYEYERRKNVKDFPLNPVMVDDVTFEPVHASLEAYARLLVSPPLEKVADCADSSIIYELPERAFWAGKKYIKLFEGNNYSDKLICEALEKYGVLLAGLVYSVDGVPLKWPVDAVAVIGYGIVGGTTYFVYIENYGNFSRFYRPNSQGGPRFRMIPGCRFLEAYAFPRSLSLEARYEALSRSILLRCFDDRGVGVDPVIIEATYPSARRPVKFERLAQGLYSCYLPEGPGEKGELEIKVSKPYYWSPDGGPISHRTRL